MSGDGERQAGRHLELGRPKHAGQSLTARSKAGDHPALGKEVEVDAEPRDTDPSECSPRVAVDHLDGHFFAGRQFPSNGSAGVVAWRVGAFQLGAGFGIDEANEILVVRRGVRKPAVAAEKKPQLRRRGERLGTQHAGERLAAGGQTGDVVFISPPVARVAFLREPRAAGRVIRVRMVFPPGLLLLNAPRLDDPRHRRGRRARGGVGTPMQLDDCSGLE